MDTQKKYSYKLIFIFAILVSQIGFSQKIIIKENVPTDFRQFNMEKGPNKKKYSFLEFSVGTLLPISLNGDESMAIKPSFDYQLSANFKRKISPILSFTNVLGISNLRVQAKSIYELNDFGLSSSALNPKFSIWNLMYQSESMNVSKRTIETNFYRVRKKLKMNKIDYRSLKQQEGN